MRLKVEKRRKLYQVTDNLSLQPILVEGRWRVEWGVVDTGGPSLDLARWKSFTPQHRSGTDKVGDYFKDPTQVIRLFIAKNHPHETST